jgi:hypothetical protein
LQASTKHIRIVTYVVLAGVLIYGYGLLLTGAYFSHPNVEDFSLCATPKNYGLLYGIQDLLLNYDGRYFTNLLHAINPLAFGCIACFKWVTAFNILFPVFCLYYFLRSFQASLSKVNSLLLAALMVLTNLAMSPSIVHQIYWMVSSFVYHYSWCFYLLWLGGVIRLLRTSSSVKKWYLFLFSSIFLLASLGMNEMFLVLNSATLLGLLVYAYRFEKNSFHPISALSANGIIATIFFISNPGISNRMAIIGNEALSSSLLEQVLKGITDFGFELSQFLTYLGLLVPLIFIFHIWGFKPISKKLGVNLKVLILALLVLTGTVMTFYLPMGHEANIPHRIYTSIFGALLLVFVLIGANLAGTALDKNRASKTKTHLLGLIGAFVFSAFIVYGNNNLKLLKADFSSGAMAQYDHTMQSRYRLLFNATITTNQCWTVVTLPVLNNPPKSISHSPYIQSNRQEAYWNEAYEKYFLIEEVKLEGDSLAFQDFLQIGLTP